MLLYTLNLSLMCVVVDLPAQWVVSPLNNKLSCKTPYRFDLDRVCFWIRDNKVR